MRSRIIGENPCSQALNLMPLLANAFLCPPARRPFLAAPKHIRPKEAKRRHTTSPRVRSDRRPRLETEAGSHSVDVEHDPHGCNCPILASMLMQHQHKRQDSLPQISDSRDSRLHRSPSRELKTTNSFRVAKNPGDIQDGVTNWRVAGGENRISPLNSRLLGHSGSRHPSN
jgi:hypothetical protein